MEGKIDIKNKQILIILYVMYAVGIAGHLLVPARGLMLTLTPLTLLFTGGLVIYATIREEKRIIIWFLSTYLITFLLEVIGVKTGLVFGSYEYGTVLGLKILEAPLIIGLNWILVILGALLLAEKAGRKIILISLSASLLAVIFDFILEPVAIELGYWSWSGDKIPIQNYLAWFLIAFTFSLFFLKLNIKLKSNLPVHYFLIQLTFFITLNITL